MGPFDAFWLATAVRLSAPLVFASTGELVSERAGILNVGLEGMMLAGAFFGFRAATCRAARPSACSSGRWPPWSSPH
jgi:simple sugar transport system permease protein